jgi:hypothetical protein
MSRRTAKMAGALLAVFGCLVLGLQILGHDSKRLGMASVAGSFSKGNYLAKIHDIAERDSVVDPAAGSDRRLDLVLPEDARLFMTGVIGTTNGSRLGHYYFLTYYLFPRDVAVTLDQPRFTPEGIQGRGSESDREMLTNGFDVRVDLTSNAVINVKTLHDLPLKTPANPGWFDSPRDKLTAFLLPPLTALAGMWLLRLLFGPLSRRQPLAEQLACALGLGMMAVAAFTLGIKLCGFHGRGWVLGLATAGALAELWRDRAVFLGAIAGSRKWLSRPAPAVLLVIGLVVFLILFRLAGLQGGVEFDAVAAWLFKAKIFFLCTGQEIVHWFSNPRLAYAHLDYPTLVPSLHAATYDSIGHVDEFVTKFWPTWMLLFLLLALASMSRGRPGCFHAPLFFLLGVLLLPFAQAYVQMEGGTLPMVFFTVLGFGQCAVGLVEQNRVRLALGLTLLFGAAMTKFEGIIFLALTAGWILLLPWARPSLKPSPRLWRVLAFCFLAALPFIGLRAQIPALHFESGWAGYAAAHPGLTLSSAPGIFLILLARQFGNSNFAQWDALDGHVHWAGHWTGISSLFHFLTFGMAWVCLLLTILLWLAAPARRPIIVWAVAVFASAVAVLAVVFASFVSVGGLNDVIVNRIADQTAGRYLFPLLLAWGAAMVILCFAEANPAEMNPPLPEIGKNQFKG